ncbi:hypothetical protein ABZ464_40695 [Streptomyces sp. NPDC005820]|uniref:hypothetical protein n=1 Tax=Streptomyces sp. NPDC005820 TaxID=3157069 RepID=UPI0033C6F797
MEVPASSPLASPFMSPLPGAGSSGPRDPRAEAAADLLCELYEDEMEQALAELLEQSAAVHAEHTATTVGAGDPRAADQAVRQWLTPLAEHAEQMLDQLAASAGAADTASLTEAETDLLFESTPPVSQGLEPAFEGFLGALGKLARKAVTGAVSLAKKGIEIAGKITPIGIILGALKKLVRPLLERVLKYAMGRIPVPLRPIAATLARKLMGESSAATEGWSGETGGTALPVAAESAEAYGPAPAARMTQDMGAATASLLLARDESEQADRISEAAAHLATPPTEQAPESVDTAVLDAARARFTARLAELPSGGDPRPATEEFLPALVAVLPLVKTGISIIGRDKVVGFVGGLLAKLISGLVGPEAAAQLSPAIADAGLRLLSLETQGEDPRETAAEALAATVEDTVRSVGRLTVGELEDPVRLEAATVQAFHEAVAAGIPAARLRPDLPELEAPGRPEVWIRLPRVHPHRFRYRKYSQPVEAVVHLRQAQQLRNRHGISLATLLRDRHRVQSYPVRVRIHLYEALPGTWLRQIALLERLRTQGSLRLAALLPLTPEAAGLLTGHPGLGRPAARAVKGRPLPAGARFFGVELVGAGSSPADGIAAPAVRPLDSFSLRSPSGPGLPRVGLPAAHGPLPTVPPAALGGRPPGRTTQVNVRVDLRAGSQTFALGLYLSESRAQEVLRRSGNPPAPAAFIGQLAEALAEGAVTAVLHNPRAHVRIQREAGVPAAQLTPFAQLSPPAAGEEFVSALAPMVKEGLLRGLRAGVEGVLAQYFRGRSEEFTRALQDPADGVTVLVTLPATPLAELVAKVLDGRLPTLADVASTATGFASVPTAGVKVVAGFRLP